MVLCCSMDESPGICGWRSWCSYLRWELRLESWALVVRYDYLCANEDLWKEEGVQLKSALLKYR